MGQRPEQRPPCAPAFGRLDTPLPALRGILALPATPSALKARGDPLTTHTCAPTRPPGPARPGPAPEPLLGARSPSPAPGAGGALPGPACGRYAPTGPSPPRPGRVRPDAARVATGAEAGRRLRLESAAPPRAGRWAGPEEARGSAGRATPRPGRGGALSWGSCCQRGAVQSHRCHLRATTEPPQGHRRAP